MDHKKSISALFSYANGSKHKLTESESRKSSICTVYNGKNCLTPSYEYPYYSPSFQSSIVIEKGSSTSGSEASTPSSDEKKIPTDKFSGLWKVIICIIIISLLLSSVIYLERHRIEHFIKNQLQKIHFFKP